jgi:molecular chaperone DnaJ
MDNFYNTIGVNETATQDEIKKAYRKLAIEHHPDKGGDENKFKKISEAYDTLGDEIKRSQYDNQRQNPFNNMGGGGFNPFEDLFKGAFHTQRRRTVPDKIIEVQISALESFIAGDKVISYSRQHMCNDCVGQGGDRDTCNVCNGDGFIVQKIGGSMFSQVVRQTCNKCKGNGFSYKKTCGTCHGQTTRSETESIKIKLPHGIDDGQFLRLQGKGDYKDGMYGNLVIRVKVISENNFEKLGDDLIYNAYFDLDGLRSDNLEIPHPQGNISIKLPTQFDTSKPLRVKSKGYNNVGDMFVKLFVRFNRN